MGIDAEMFVRRMGAFQDDEVRRIRLLLAGAFGADSFWIHKKDGVSGEAPLDYSDENGHRHCCERIPEYQQNGPTIEPEPGEHFLRVYLAQRYYGEGYERGDLPKILSVAAFLQDVTGGRVWYGGDSSGVLARELDDAYRKELWAHFVAVGGNEPYHGRDFGGEGVPRPHCSFCGGAPMRFFGTGHSGRRAIAECRGCGAEVETLDKGATWAVYKKG